MTKKFFWQDPCLAELDTTIQKVDGDQLILKETIFFTFSGGQESDEGTVENYPVLKSEKKDKEIIYTISSEHNFKVNDEVKISIDWGRRYKLMRLHFAAELILELAIKKFPNILKIGAHISAEKSRIDFAWKENISSHLPDLQKAAQIIIDSEKEIIKGYSNLEKEERFWEIEGFSKVPCGGTHVKNTREIGHIFLKRINLGKDKERIEIYLP